MATFGDILSSLSIGAGQSVRRNAGDSAFEAYTPSGGGGAPTNAEYLVGATDGTLTNERLVTNTTSITWDLTTPGQAKVERAALTGDVTASANSNTTTIDKTAITGKTTVTAASGDFLLITDASDSDNLKKVDASDFLSGSGAPISAQYVTLATDGTLTNERVLTAGNLIDLADGGAGGNLTIDVDLSEASTISAIASDDTVALFDTSAVANGKVTIQELLYQLNILQPRLGFRFYSDFISETSTTGTDNAMVELNSGTGAATSTTVTDSSGRIGLARSTTGTTATGRAAVSSSGTAIRLGGGKWFYEIYLNVATLSDATNRYQLVVGFLDTLTAANQVDAVAFVYDEGGVSTGSTASANWQQVTSSNSTRTWNGSGVAVAAATWVRLGIEINAAASSVTYYINGTATGTAHTTNIPTAAGRELGFGWLLIKSVGTTARTVDFDYINVVNDLTTSR